MGLGTLAFMLGGVRCKLSGGWAPFLNFIQWAHEFAFLFYIFKEQCFNPAHKKQKKAQIALLFGPTGLNGSRANLSHGR